MPSSPKRFKVLRPDKAVTPWEPSEFDAPMPAGEDSVSQPNSSPPDDSRGQIAHKSRAEFTLFQPRDWPAGEPVLRINLLERAAEEGSVSSMSAQPDVDVWIPPELDFAYPVDVKGFGGMGNVQKLRARVEKNLQAANSSAQEILLQAEAQSSEMLLRAEAQMAELTRQATDQASEIKRQAYADGVAAANAETEGMLRAASALVEEVNAWRETTLANSEMSMLRLVIEIAQTIFGDGLPLDPESLGQSFTRALSQSKTLGNLRVYAHPDDVTVLGSHWPEKQAAISGQRIELVPSDIIKRGGCFVEGQYGSVDARVESQMNAVKEALLRTYSPSEGEVE